MSNKLQSGSILIYTVIIIFIFSSVMLGILSYATIELRTLRGTTNNEQAFQMAEAGANYYQWHLAHFANDYADGTGQTCSPTCGPYVHNYVDKDTGQTIGVYSLTITPPPVGSTIVTIVSTGYTYVNTNQKRIITVRYGIPSLAKYAFLTNSDAWIGSTESINGEFHTNGGLRFDGTGNAPITSSKSTYVCGTSFGCGPATKPGIWGAAPASTQAFWQYPVPNVDFTSMTADLATIKSSAQSGGIYLPPSSKSGYSIVFNSNGTLTIYVINSLLSNPTGFDTNCNPSCTARNEKLDYNSRSVLAGYNNIAIPSNGLIFVEDNTWVEGTVKGRVMVVAAKLPYNAATAPFILIPNNIVYAAKDGTCSLGLIAQKDFIITYRAPSNLEIDAAIVAQNGVANYFNFSPAGNPAIEIKNTITIYGSLASYGVWTWSWVSGATTISGYPTTVTVYDSNLLYAPPPSFPLTSNGYQQISWSSN